MPKNTANKTPSRIRFIMVEAELGDGDVGQITQAIQNALRGPSPTIHRIGPVSEKKNPNSASANEDEDFAVEHDVDCEMDAPVSPPKARGQRKPPKTPDVLTTVDLGSEPSLASFANAANPKNDRKRFLVIASWFKQHRATPAITVDHVYTCYRHLKWPSNIKDFGQPLRDLKADQYMTSASKGEYEVNHLGQSEVDKLCNGGE